MPKGALLERAKIYLARCGSLFYERTILFLAILFLAGLGLMTWHISRLQGNLVTTMALASAEFYAQTIEEFRTLYTSEVVERVRSQGIEVVPDYEDRVGAIPLPATLSMKLGQNIGARNLGAQTRLYSAYPFPWREGLKDKFGREAWDYLRNNPDQSYHRIEPLQGRMTLRYAKADLMRDACVDCHNTVAQSPKTDWKVGDVRGVLEIDYPLDAIEAIKDEGIQGTMALISTLALVWLGGVGLAIGKLRRTSVGLEQVVSSRTSELREANRNLEEQASEREKTQVALRESEKRYRTLVENAPEAIVVLEVDSGRFVDVNENAARLFKFSREDLLRLGPSDLSPELQPDQQPSAEAASKLIQRALEGESLTFEWLHRDAVGTEIPCEVRLLRLPSSQAKLVRGSVTDIRPRKQAEKERHELEAQVQHSQKLESLGVLAGGIAHDFNNLLTPILGHSDLALSKLAPTSPALEHIEYIQKASLGAAELCQQMLAYSGRGQFVVRSFSLSSVVKEMGHLLQTVIPKNVAVEFNLAEDLPPIEADSSQIQQVFLNLVTNAADAIGEENGFISITTGTLEVSDDYAYQAIWDESLDLGLYTYVEVTDNGCGMDDETRSRIFEPFFTTKETGRGLGLAAVLGIVRAHHGTIKIYSEVGRGSTFKVLLPCTEKSEEPLEQNLPSPTDWRGSGTVLVIDDEKAVRIVAARMLESKGFQVLTAEDGVEALEVFQKNRDRIRAVLLDLSMPQMGGEEVFRELRKLQPGIPVIMSSGYNEKDVTRKFVGKDLTGFVQKPYRQADLMGILRRILEL